MVDPTTTRTVPSFVRALGEAYDDRPAIVAGDELLTYRDLDTRSALLARGLLARGVGKGSRIGFVFGNSPEWVVAWAAIARTGAVPVPLSTFSKPPELARVIRHADLQGVIAQRTYRHQDFVEHLGAAFPTLADTSDPELRFTDAPFLRWIVFADGDVPAWAHPMAWFEDGAERYDEQLLRAAEESVHPDEPGLMIYTSGQSASPKGVLLSHGGVMAKTHYLRHMLEIDADSVKQATMPFFWVGGLVMTLFTTLDAGGIVVCGDAPVDARVLGSRGQNSINPADAQFRMFVGLGMTETFGIYSWGREAADPERSVCTPLVAFEPGYDIKVVDPLGRPVADGGRGEMLVRGPTMMLGLHKVDRAEALDSDGFYRTGDEVQVVGDTLLFVGRLGDMIKTSGANVAPAEVEQELLALEGIASAYVVAIPDKKRGQLVGAAVVADEGIELDESAILATLRARLSTYKVPKLLVVLERDEVPMLPSMKLAKPELARLVRERAAGAGD
jgi:acyl-CoA synthetase (AMP-forming)/AMP-acid ligase II